MRFIIAVLIALPGAAGALNTAEVGRPVHLQIGVDPGSLDPNHLESLVGTTIAANLYEPLVRLGNNGKIEPALAEKFEVSKDGLTYKFKMRANAKWSDGKPVTVEDCIFGFTDPLDPKTATDDAAMLFAIKGAQEFYRGKAPRDKVAVTKAGEWCKVELSEPQSNFLPSLTLAFTSPKRADQKGHFPGPTTGHYFIQSLSSTEIKLAPNPENHEDGQLPIEIKILNEEAAALNLFETGKIDILTTITPSEISRLETKGLIFKSAMSATNFLAFNLKKPPFDQLNWRRAVAASVDREGLDKAMGGLGQATTCFLPSSVQGYEKVSPPDFKAAQELIRKMSEKPAIHIGYAPSGMASLALGKIQSDLHNKLGANVILEPAEQKVYFYNLNHHAAPPVYFLGNAALAGDPDLHLRHFLDDPVLQGNASNYHSDKFEALYKKIKSEARESQRAKLIREAVRVLQEEDVILVPLFERRQFFGVSSKLRGFEVNPESEISYHRLRWAKSKE